MNATDTLKSQKNELINKYAHRSNWKASWQTLNTMLPILGLMYVAVVSVETQPWLSLLLIVPLTLLLLRGFVMLHDCGHGCQFKTPWLNNAVGFVWGVICGIPQYVWSKHHDYHHATNGNWNKYRGPLAVLSVDQFAELDDKQQRKYQNQRKLYMAPLAGFLYFIFNPRFTWMKGSLQLLAFIIKNKIKNPSKSLGDIANEFETGYWATWKEYWHMAANNAVLLTLWVLAANYFGALAFFSVYIVSLSLAGAFGIILFTVQHNFEDSYATGDEDWNYFTAALEGTSFLTMPSFMHWFTGDIGYHHIHHLSARIPNYNLVKCHKEFAHLFGSVKRLTLLDIPHSFKFILWDNHANKIISVEQFESRYGHLAQAA